MTATTTYQKGKTPRAFVLYTWEDFELDVRQILTFLDGRGKRYNGVYALPRGGLVLGVRLSHELDIPLISGGVTQETLVVDDIADSGDALSTFINRSKCDTIVLHRNIHCPIKPTFWAQDVEGYVVYPWESKKEMERESARTDIS